jgi:hypothetical protein
MISVDDKTPHVCCLCRIEVKPWVSVCDRCIALYTRPKTTLEKLFVWAFGDYLGD